jgi:hypothetical protein
MDLSEQLKKDISKKTFQSEEDLKNFQQQILVIDAEKEPYDNAVVVIDKEIYETIQTVNDSMYATQTAYQNRINSGCKSDLIWTVSSVDSGTGYYNLVARKLSSNGYPKTDSLVVGTASSVGILDPVTSTIVYYPTDAKVGLTTQNLYAMVYYYQPYLKDIGDTTLGTFVGKIGTGSTELAIISTTPDELIPEFAINNLVTCSKQGVFVSPTNKIVGFGTTTITGVSTSTFYSIIGIATTSLTTRTLILENATVGFSSLPESDGSFVNYTVVVSPDDPEEAIPKFKYQVKFTKNPYSPEEIGIITPENFGKGYEIKINNKGYPSATQSWKPELKGTEKSGEKIREPDVSGGSIYFREGFSYRPVNILGSPVSEGATASVLPASFSLLYQSTSSCSSSITSGITSALAYQNQIEESVFGECATSLKDVANAIREERNEYSLRIWGMRQSMGQRKEDYNRLKELDNYIKQKDKIIDGKEKSNCT